MKNFTQKFIGILALVFVICFNVNGQEITPDMFSAVYEWNGAESMNVGFSDDAIVSFAGNVIGAFYDLDGDGQLENVGIDIINDGSAGDNTFTPLAIWGDDVMSPEIDGLPTGATPIFAILILNEQISYMNEGDGEHALSPYSGLSAIYEITGFETVLTLLTTIEFPGYQANGIFWTPINDVVDANGSSVYGCTIPSSCEYNPQMIYNDGSCVNYPEENYDCSGNCVNDSDGDGVCNENEIIGCLDPDYVEYNPLVTDAEENSCLTTWQEGYFSQVGEIFDLQNLNDNLGNELENVSYQLDTLTDTYQALLEAPQCEEIIIGIQEGWNIFGYTSSQVLDISDVMAAFSEYIYIIKDNNGAQYWGGDVNYNGIGDFIPGEGYQIKAFAPFSISFEN